MVDNIVDNIVDKKYIDEYVGIAGAEPMLQGVQLFRNSADGYLDNAAKLFKKDEFEESGKELHKLKGAASSIGLLRLSHETKKVQVDMLAAGGTYDLQKTLVALHTMISNDADVLENYLNKDKQM